MFLENGWLVAIEFYEGKSVKETWSKTSVAQPARFIKQYQITFEKLLTADSAATFGNLAQNEMATVVPFVSDNSVVTIAEVAKDDKGWRVTSLVDQSVSNDLNALQAVTGDTSQREITSIPKPSVSPR
jgi:hypothetical protein